MHRWSLTIGAAALIGMASAPCPATAQDVPVPIDTVQLRFDWDAGTHARVATTRFRERIAETADTAAGGARYRMNVQGHDEGLLISYDDFSFPPPADTTQAAQLSAVAEQAAAMVPKFIVDTAGVFVRIHDAASVRIQLDSLMARLLGPDELAAVREGLARALSEEALTGLAAQEWNAIVGMWVGADLEIGEVYEFEETAELPMIPDARVRMISEFAIEGRTPCVEGGSVDDCVEIRLVSYPDPGAMKEVLTQYMQRLLAAPGLGGIGFESLVMENEMILITEPATLRPHRVWLSKSVTGVVTAEGERSEVSQTDIRTYEYTYTP